MKWTGLYCSLALFLSGCVAVNNQAYRPDPNKPIRTVAIAREVAMPKKMVFYGFSQSMLVGAGAGLGGAVGGALMAAGTTTREAAPELGLPESLRHAFATEIAKTGRFSIRSSGADAELALEVVEYGFYQAGFMRREVKPILRVKARLIRGNGKIVWEQFSFVHFKSRATPANLPEKMRENPQLATSALRRAADLVAADAVKTLRP